ncbi:glycosyltransferase family 4 protein [Mycolicibacterium grossiae]|nr:glycosyltransferase family 4 protein [Mycolicibacterium grossiae]QEM43842.1 glycosyltransferase family 4 protein [Mycolicibacterium grossiae]
MRRVDDTLLTEPRTGTFRRQAPMLLNVNNYHFRGGGADGVYLDHAALMERAGWRCGYFSMRHARNEPTPWSRYFVDELEFRGDYPPAQRMKMAAKAVYSFEAQRKLRSLLSDARPDVAHLHNVYHHLSPSILSVLTEHEIPTVLTAHDLKIACPNYKMLDREGICERCKTGSVINVVRRRCVQNSLAASVVVAAESALQRSMQTYRRNVAAVIVPSRFYVEKFVEWGWPRERLVHIPNFIDASWFTPGYEPGDYFLYFGRLADEKGVATLLRAAASAGVRLVVAGTGPAEDELRSLATRLGGDVTFVGFRTGDALHDLVRGSRAVVLPSEWYENAPLSALEGFAMGKPLIGARIGGIPETIVEDVNGWTFASGDVADLADVLSRVDATPDAVIAERGRAARELVRQRFDPHTYVERVSALYQRLGVPTTTSSTGMPTRTTTMEGNG